MDAKDNISEQLSAYLDGELSEAEVRRVEEALRSDPALARELEALQAARELVRSLPAAKAPEDFAAAVMDKAERLQLIAPTPRVRRWRVHWASLATAAVVLITVGVGIVVTLSVTLTPSWQDKLAREGARDRLTVAPAEEAPPTATPAEAKEPPAVAGAKGRGLDVVHGTGRILPGLAASADRPADQLGRTNIEGYGLREGEDRGRGTVTVAGGQFATDEKGAKSVEQIGVMPPIAAMPGPPADRRAGVVTQVGEPIYTTASSERAKRSELAEEVVALATPEATSSPEPTIRPMAVQDKSGSWFEAARALQSSLAGTAGGQELGDRVRILEPARSVTNLQRLLGAYSPAGGPQRTAPPALAEAAPAAAPVESVRKPSAEPPSAELAFDLAAKPTSLPASEPASQPASAPASQPASQPASAAASAPSAE